MTTLYHLLKLQSAMGYNKLVYGLQKIPLVGRLVSDKLYRAEGFQKLMTFLGVLQGLFTQVLGKGLYFAFVYLMAYTLSGPGKYLGLKELDLFYILLVALSLAYGPIMKNLFVITPDLEDVLCIKIYGLAPKTYYQLRFFYDQLVSAIFYALGLSIAFYLFGQGPVAAIYFTLLNMGLRLLVRFYMNVYISKGDKLNLDDLGSNWIFYGLFLPLATLILLSILHWQLDLNLAPLAFTPWAGLGGLVLSLVYFHRLYRSDLLRQVATQTLTAKMVKNEDELDLVKATMNLEDKDLILDLPERIKKLEGISYINQVFYYRLSRIFFKMVRTRVIILGLISLVVLGLGFYFRESLSNLSPKDQEELNKGLVQILPGALLYISSLLYVSDHLAKLSFYHLDRTLMGDPLYRSPKMVLYSLRVRLKKALSLNLWPLLILMALTASIKAFVPQVPWTILAFLMAWEVLMMGFFSLYHLYIYYMIQPYDVGMKAKSPLYQVLNAIIFFFSYQSIQIFIRIENPLPAYGILAGVMVIFLLAGYFLVQVLAPKNFKLRH